MFTLKDDNIHVNIMLIATIHLFFVKEKSILKFESKLFNQLNNGNVKNHLIEEAKARQGERLKALREENNLTQESMAELLDCTPQHISYIENGHRFISKTLAVKIAEKFNVNYYYVNGTSIYKTEFERKKAEEEMQNEPSLKMEIVEYLRSFENLPFQVAQNTFDFPNSILSNITNSEFKYFFGDINDYAEFKLRKILKKYVNDTEIDIFFKSIN